MTVIGSSLINTSANGQPSNIEDRPFSFALGTQIFINPSDDPTDAIVEFKLTPSLLAGTLPTGESNLAIGFASDSELNTLSNWDQAYVSSADPNRFVVGFGRLNTAPDIISVNIQGIRVSSVARDQSATGVDVNNNSLTINSHPFSTGDRVVISSSATTPTGLVAGTAYFVIADTSNSIKLATTYQNALGGSEIDIQSSGSGTITVASDEIFTLTRAGATGTVSLARGSVTVATFTNQNVSSPLRLFYWCREQSASATVPVLKEIKVRGAI